MKLDVNDTQTDYTDVSSTYWAAGYISAASKNGLMEGFTDGSFKPNQDITREEFATIIARYFQVERDNSVQPLESHFSDTSSSWARSTIEEIYRYKIINGYTDGTFQPKANIMRAETVTMINRMLFRGPIENSMEIFPDVTKDKWYYGNVEEASKTHEYIVNPDGTETVTQWIDDNLR